MQTTGLSSSHAPSTRNPADNLISEKPPHAADEFGDVMHRALTGAKANQAGVPHSPFTDEIDKRNETASDQIKADRKRAVAKKSEHRAADTQYTGMNGAPAAAPLRQPNQSASAAQDSEEAKGSSPTIPNEPAKAESVDASKKTDTADESSESSGTQAPDAQSAAADSEHAPAATSDATKALATQALEPNSDPAEPASGITARESSPQNTPITLSKAPIEPTSASQPDAHGTSAAKQDMTMKKADKTPKVAGQTEQDLPGIAVTGSEEPSKGQKVSPKDDLHGSAKLETASIEMPLRVLSSNDSPAPTVTVAAATISPTLDARVLERTHDIVALHAMRVTDTNSDSLHVVVKPGAGIQLSLELRQSARGIEVHASLHKGNFEQLSQHWPDLQQRLEARGVRLGSLTTAENFTNRSHQQFQQSNQQSPNQDPRYAGAFAEFALAGSMTEAPGARAARAAAYRGWETWA
jgi:hypothetical protein